MDARHVLDIFKEITRIPRESGHEGPMTEWLVRRAESRGLAWKKDDIGNVLIAREAAPGKESVPTLVLQCHQDMVCEKRPGVRHDFLTDPIRYEIEDGWMVAKDTTLGADDGIGIAAALAVLEDDVPTGRIEAVFTISEETGMDGAFGMEPGFFTGKTLINLDSEDEGQLFIGCAGGLNTEIRYRYEPQIQRAGAEVVRLEVGGALGGHSGDDINKGRLNAVQTLARFLEEESDHGFQLILLRGGGKPNAIARDAEAILSVQDAGATLQRFAAFGRDVKGEYAVTDPGATFTGQRYGCTEKALDDDTALRLVRALCSAPHGVETMSQDIPGLVETSTNLAAVRMGAPGEVLVITSQRSSTPSARRMMARKVAAHFLLSGADKVEHLYEYPGWKPNVHSHILSVCTEAYRRLFGSEAEVKAIHAGLECGLFEERFGGLDKISFGPTLRGVHAPGERMELASLDRFVALLEDVVVHFS